MPRKRDAAKGHRCQLCGIEFARRVRVYLFISDPQHWFQTRPRALKRGTITAMDTGLLHYRCACLALAFCPHLIKRRRNAALAMFSAPAHVGWKIDTRLIKWRPLPSAEKMLKNVVA